MLLVVSAGDDNVINIDYQVLVNHNSKYLIHSWNHSCWCITVSLLYDVACVMSRVAGKGGVFL